MKIILVNPPSHTHRRPEEHLGLAYLKSYLDSHDFKVVIIDGYLCRLKQQDIIKKIAGDKQAVILGLSPSLDSLKESLEISRQVKRMRSNIYICWGGHLASFSARDLLAAYPFIDFIVRGEGELTFLEVVEKINASGKLKLAGIKGLAYRQKGKIIFSPPRDLIEDLDCLPFPDRSHTQRAVRDGSLVEISGSRGCYGNCSFCSINSLYKLSNGQSWRGRSASNIVDELAYINQRFGFVMFKFVDDSFFGTGKAGVKRVREIAREIINRKLKIRFRISVRANDVDYRLFKQLKKAGLYSVSIGIESGVQRVLNTFNKGITINQNKEALRILRRLKIITLMGFIGFDPYITFTEVQENVRFLQTTKFCLSDVISKPLFVHAEDAITKQLTKDKLVDGRDFPNYTYRIRDKRARLTLESLQYWNSFNRELYYKISDPLTAPRLTSPKTELILLRLNRQMREIDLKVYKNIVGLIEQGETTGAIRNYLDQQKKIVTVDWQKIAQKFRAIHIR